MSSYVEAAKKLFVTPQAISKSISELERELGVKLLEKSGRGVKPTSFAISLADPAEEPLQAFLDFKSFAQDQLKSTADSGTIILGVATAYYRGVFFSVSDFTRFRQTYPNINLELMVYSSESCLAALQEEVLDAAILLGRLHSVDYECHKLYSFAPYLTIAESHELTAFSQISLDQLDGCTLAMPLDLRYEYLTLKTRLRKYHIHPRFESVGPLAEAQHSFITSGGAILVTKNAEIVRMFPRVKLLPFNNDGRLTFSLYLAFKRGKVLSPIPLLCNYMHCISKLYKDDFRANPIIGPPRGQIFQSYIYCL